MRNLAKGLRYNASALVNSCCTAAQMCAMLAKLFSRRQPLVSAETLTRFLCEKAALVTQKTIIGYCYARTSLPLNELMRDKPFAEAFERGRGQAYAAVLEDMFVVAEGRLRPATTDNSGLGNALAARFRTALAATEGLTITCDQVAAVADRLRTRIQEAQGRAPRSIADIASVSGERVYEAMPIHERHRRPDRDAIIAGVRFLMVGLAGEFDRRIDARPIAADLLLSPTPK